MFENIGLPELLVLVVAGLFILGPERLPDAARWLGNAVRQVREYATGARDHLKTELGPEYESLREPLNDLRSLRSLNPRTAITRSLFADDGPLSGSANGVNGAAAAGGAVAGGAAAGAAANGAGTNGAGTNGAAANGSVSNGSGPGGVTPARAPEPPLTSGERPPVDPDAT
ncbi:Sec-independent protein translocase protein TatB [Pseudonocardia phyllosphaerae]|uniref:Sec-independent protein translocase protein TatB n=1 Tax=Pseudonocardia phyllosphaerae TaxID=3390502 RepID=UPI00397E227A